MILRLWVAAASFAAMAALASSADTGPTVVRVVTREQGGHRHLSAWATISGDSVLVRVSHRAPGGALEPGEHIHLRVVGAVPGQEIVRGLPRRSPRARLRKPGDLIQVTVSAKGGSPIREVRIMGVPRPHPMCQASNRTRGT